jgi:dolichol-phosphate mannosyltransferase
MLIRAWKKNKLIVEQPIIFVDRLYGKSKLGAGEVFIYLQGMMKLFFEY